MKARIIATGEIINVRKVITNIGDELYEPLRLEWSNVKFKASDLDFLPEKETAVMEGFVARDQEGYISLFPDKPERDMYDWNDVTYGFWDEANGHHIELSTAFFPSVTWDSEPKKVKIEITLIEE